MVQRAIESPTTEILPRERVPVEHVDHPTHYGGADNPYEAIKIIEALGLGFCLGNCVKYICRHGKKDGIADDGLRDLQKARWYLDREIVTRERLALRKESK